MNLNEDKFIFGLLSLVLTVSGWLLIFKFPLIGIHFPTLVGGVTGIYAIFAGSHVARSWVDSKADAPQDSTTTTTTSTVSAPPPPQEPPPVVVPPTPPHPSVVPDEVPLKPVPPVVPEMPKSLAEIAKSLEKIAEKKSRKR